MNVSPDWSLRVRMALAILAMVGVYVVVVGAAASWAVAHAGPVGVIGVLTLAGMLLAFQYRYAPKAALNALDAKPVNRWSHPDLHARVTRLATQAGVEQPDVAVTPHDAPNAFATAGGRGPATVAVTEGLLDAVDDEELDAVLAHEIAHIQHRDALLLSVVTVLVTIGSVVVRHFWWFGGGGGDGGGGGGDGQPWFLVFVAVSLVAWIGGYLLTRIISRQREYAADRGAAALTGKPGAMAAAIENISSGMAATPDDDLRDHAELNALFLVPADAKSRVLDAMQTHPDPDDRIERLSALSAEFEGD